MTTSTVYTIYWQPSGYQFPSGYIANLNQYFKDLQATSGKNTNTYVNGTQYYQESANGTKQYVQYHTTFAGTTLDTDALPPLDPVNCPDTPFAADNGPPNPPSTTASCVTDGQLQQEISAVVKAKGWPVNNNTEFFMYTAPNIGTCFNATVGVGEGGVGTQASAPLCSFEYFCAYHSCVLRLDGQRELPDRLREHAVRRADRGQPADVRRPGLSEREPVGPGGQHDEPRAQREHHRPVRHRLVGQQLERQRRR